MDSPTPGRVVIDPFSCPNCGHEIIIDMMQPLPDPAPVPHYKARLLDLTSGEKARLEGELRPGLYSLDRAELARENVALRFELARRSRPWWRRGAPHPRLRAPKGPRR